MIQIGKTSLLLLALPGTCLAMFSKLLHGLTSGSVTKSADISLYPCHRFRICSVAKLVSNNLIMKFLIAPSLSFLCQHSMYKVKKRPQHGIEQRTDRNHNFRFSFFLSLLLIQRDGHSSTHSFPSAIPFCLLRDG